jgi:hypothetical protein
MGVLTQESMFTVSNTPGCSKYQLVELNMELFRRLDAYEFGTDDYEQAVKAFHEEVRKRVQLLSGVTPARAVLLGRYPRITAIPGIPGSSPT